MVEFIKFSIDFELNQIKSTNDAIKNSVYRSSDTYIKSIRFTSSSNDIDFIVLTDGSVLVFPFSIIKRTSNPIKKVRNNFLLSRNDIFSKFNKN